MAVPSQKELDFIASFARFNLSSDQDQKETLVEPEIVPEPYHQQFHLFNNLLPEIRNQIWDLTLPLPRIILIKPIEIAKRPDADVDHNTPAAVEYIASPCSYGGRHPVALSICRESRGQALRHLTERFHAYWDLNQDVAYLEVKRWSATKTMEAITDMRSKGFFEGFKKVATDIDIWHIQDPEPCLDLLRKCPQITNFYFICRYRNWHKDIVNPGVSWYLVDADSQQQTEFRAHKDWCHVIMKYQKKMVDVVQKDTKDHEGEWSTRPSQPSMEMKIIEGRKMEELPKGPEFYHPPAPEGFFRSLMPHNGVTR